jgi:hypothetical protein
MKSTTLKITVISHLKFIVSTYSLQHWPSSDNSMVTASSLSVENGADIQG